MEKESIAYELLQDTKKANKRMFIIWLITFLAFLGLLTYTIYLLNDITTVTTTESTEVMQDTADGNNNYIGENRDVTNG